MQTPTIKRLFTFMNVRALHREIDELKDENNKLAHLINLPEARQAKLYRKYKQKYSESAEAIRDHKESMMIVMRLNDELETRIRDREKTNDELRKRQEAHQNTINYLLESVKQLEHELSQKDVLIGEIIEDSVIQSNKDRYFNFL